jgi:hypothetical protein
MMEATPRPGITYPVYLDWVGTTCRVFNADGASDIVVADRETGETVVAALNELDALRASHAALVAAVTAVKRWDDAEWATPHQTTLDERTELYEEAMRQVGAALDAARNLEGTK